MESSEITANFAPKRTLEKRAAEVYKKYAGPLKTPVPLVKSEPVSSAVGGRI